MYRPAPAVSIPSLMLGLLLVLGGCAGGTSHLRSPDGELAPCAARGCVSSRASESAHAVRPIAYEGSRDAARAALLRLLAEMPGVEVVTHSEDYIHARFTSTLLRTVDDLELDLPAFERVIHVRSSSRLDYFDFAANRARVEDLRARFEALQP